jgi:hypothetical protein
MWSQAQEMERLILLHEDALSRAFDGVEAHPFHYCVNMPALVMALALAGAGLVGAAVLWHTGAVPDVIWGALGAASALLGAWALHWRWVARTSFVAFTEQHLFIGDHKRAWRIERALLDAAVLGFDRMRPSRLRAQLDLRVGGQHIPLLIFHPMVFVKDMEMLTASLLAHIQQEEDEMASQDEPQPEVQDVRVSTSP